MRPTSRQIEEKAEAAAKALNEEESTGEIRWPGMTYLEGVRAALDWAAGNSDQCPLDEDDL